MIGAGSAMRPIGAPEHTVGDGCDHHLGEGHHVEVRQAPRDVCLGNGADIVEAAQLHPEAVILQEVENEPERRLIEAALTSDPRHVVDDGHCRKRPDEHLMLDDVRRINVKIEDPAKPLELRQVFAEMFFAARLVLHQMKMRAADAGFRQGVERLGIERGIDVGNATCRFTHCGDSVLDDAIVKSMGGWGAKVGAGEARDPLHFGGCGQTADLARRELEKGVYALMKCNPGFQLASRTSSEVALLAIRAAFVNGRR